MTDENERFCDGCGEPLPDDWTERLEAVPEREGDDYDGELLQVEDIDEDELLAELESMGE